MFICLELRPFEGLIRDLLINSLRCDDKDKITTVFSLIHEILRDAQFVWFTFIEGFFDLIHNAHEKNETDDLYPCSL